MKNYYKILGLNNLNATEKDITRAYRILARRYHPDINQNQDATEKFKEISESYQTLRNSEKRDKYDLKLKEYISDKYKENSADIKKNIRGHQDNSYYVVHSLKKAKNLIEKSSFKRNIEKLSKKLKNNIEKYNIFDFSNNTKKHVHDNPYEQLNIIEIMLSPKEAIFGTKKTIFIGKKEISITLPKNSYNGNIIKLKATSNNEELLVITRVRKDNFLQIEQRGIIINFPITFKEAVLGTKIKVPTFDGPCYITIPPKTNSGNELRVKNKGILQTDETRGDLFLKIFIQVQKEVQEESFQNAVNEIDKYFDYDARNKIIEKLIEQ